MEVGNKCKISAQYLKNYTSYAIKPRDTGVNTTKKTIHVSNGWRNLMEFYYFYFIYSEISNQNGAVTISPIADAPTYVNGDLITGQIALHHVRLFSTFIFFSH